SDELNEGARVSALARLDGRHIEFGGLRRRWWLTYCESSRACEGEQQFPDGFAPAVSVHTKYLVLKRTFVKFHRKSFQNAQLCEAAGDKSDRSGQGEVTIRLNELGWRADNVGMGVFGAGIFADDDALDVRSDYKYFLADAQSDERATEAIAGQYGASFEDPAQTTGFWLGLALTQWKFGRLDGRVKAVALRIIHERLDLQ